MRNRVRIVLVLLLFACGSLPAQDRFADVKVEATKVAGNVWVLTGAGGNIGVSVGDDGVLIVDDQFAPLAGRIRAAIAAASPGAGEADFVLNTHYHGDHTGGNPEFGKRARIVAHDNVRARLAAPQERNGRTQEPMVAHGLPVITFNDRLTVHVNGEPIRMIHAPASHTDGDSLVWFPESNVLHLGDLFFEGRFPFVDIDGGGSVDGLIATIGRVIEMAPAGVKIIPGHGGPIVGVDALKRYHGMLQQTASIVRARLRQGDAGDAIVADGLPEEWESWGTGFISTERWLRTLVRGLAE